MRISIIVVAFLLTFYLTASAACDGKYDKRLGKVVYTSADRMPRSNVDVSLIVARNFNCNWCKEEEYQSRFNIEFVVSENGVVSNMKINGKSGKQLTTWEQAVLDSFRRSACKWEPGVCDGEKIAVMMNVPLTICL